jgi:molecular chaperone DnaJ
LPRINGHIQKGHQLPHELLPCTQPEEILRLRGKGLPEFDRGGHGDLNIRVQVEIPEHPTADERALYEQLRALAKKNPRGKKHWRRST